MNKTILFLINGFGIEKKDSYSIYDENLLPTLDNMMKTNIFGSVESKAYDYSTAYQLFSTGSINTSNITYLNDLISENKLFEHEKIKDFNTKLLSSSSKIHIFLKLESHEVIEQLNNFIRVMKVDTSRIHVHFILNQKSLSEYKTIVKNINNFTYSNFKISNIGMVLGESCLTDKSKVEDLRIFERVMRNSKSGEAWVQYVKKFTILESAGIMPADISPFCVNDEFSMANEDIVFFFNFAKDDYQKLVEGIVSPRIAYNTLDSSTFVFYSLFPLVGSLQVQALLDNVQAKEYMADYLEKTNINALIVDEQKHLNLINFMANGLKNVVSPRVKFLLSDNILSSKENISALINNSAYELIIINTSIDELGSISDIKAKLHEIDSQLALIKELCAGKATLLVSSLFGINKEVVTSTVGSAKELVNFYGSVPFLIVDERYKKEDYSIAFGNTTGVLGTALKCVNKDSKYPSLLKGKSNLMKMFVKRK